MSIKTTEVRIFGPPGSGKTTTLSTLISEKSAEVGHENVVAGSFTKTAASELLGRNLPLNEDKIGTLHALCFRLLNGPQLTENKGVIDDWNTYAPSLTLSGGKRDLDEPWEPLAGKEEGDEIKERYDVLRNLQVHPDAYPVEIKAFAKKWEDFKAATGRLDFLDLIAMCLKEGLAPSASVGFFDEVQDFSPLELALVRRWGDGMDEIYLAGDDDQAIFSWKGATPDAFLFPALPPEQKIFLEQSYRLPRAVHALSEQLVQAIHPREPKVFRPRDAEGSVTYIKGTFNDPDFDWYHDIQAALNDGSVMVLATCAYMLDPLIALLRAEGALYSNRWRRKQRKWNPLDSATGSGALDRVGAFLRPQRQFWAEDARGWTYHDLWLAVEGLKAEVCVRGAKAAIQRQSVALPGLTVSGEELGRWFPNPEHQSALCGGDLGWLRQHMLGSAHSTMSYAIDVVQARGQLPPIGAQHQLTVGTIHSVKGGESDTVFLLGDLSRAGWDAYHAATETEMTTRRQFYVGVTRAREKLVVVEGGPLALPECYGG